MGFFDIFRRKPPLRPVHKPTGTVGQPVDLYTAMQVMDQSAPDIWFAPKESISGQPQNWSWRPQVIPNAVPGTWQANWNALPPVLRPAYGVAVVNPSGASWSLCRQIYEQYEGHKPAEGADLINKNTVNFRRFYIENGQLVHVWMNSDGTITRTILANLAYPDAPVDVLKI